jgi:hypothetical protein
MDRSNIYPPADGNKPLPQANRPSHLIVDNGYDDRVKDFDEMQWISFILININIKSEMKSKFTRVLLSPGPEELAGLSLSNLNTIILESCPAANKF